MNFGNIGGLVGLAGRVLVIPSFLIVGCIASADAFEATQAQRDACTPDAFRLCSAEIPDVPRVTACMIAKKSQLSARCRAAFNVGHNKTARRHHRHVSHRHYAHHHRHHTHRHYADSHWW